jgi:hypothetical protein
MKTLATAALLLASVTGAHASVTLTPSNPSFFSDYPAPTLTSDIKPTPNIGFIIVEFADHLFEADDQLRVLGFSTTDGSGVPYLDTLVSGPEDNILIQPADVPHGPGSISISLVAGDWANLLQFRVGYCDDAGREFDLP